MGAAICGPYCCCRDLSAFATRRSSSGPPIDHEKNQELMRRLREVYTRGYAFPAWVVDHFASRTALFEEDAKRCKIFYDDGDDPKVVLELATKREPVNIGMSRLFDAEKLDQLCGWREGAYGKLSGEDASRLPPNLAIMCPTPVVSGMRDSEGVPDAHQKRCIEDPKARMHVLNVIGIAFDHHTQPDQRHFSGSGRDAKVWKAELARSMEKIFDKIFAAAVEYKLEVIVLARFGAGAFSVNYPGQIYEEVWLPAYVVRLTAWAARLKQAGVVEIGVMGGSDSTDEHKLFQTAERLKFKTKVYGFFPDPLRKELGDRLSKALVVNAWDCWSFIGNGNFHDASLDGYIGRCTALAVLGWPKTNPYLTQEGNMVKVTPPR